MKKLFTLLATVPVASLAFGQAITITAADVPMPTAPFNLYSVNAVSIPNPVGAPSMSLDYSSYTGSGEVLDYITETDAFFTSAGSDKQLIGEEKHLNASMVYFYSPKFDLNSTGVYENAIDIAEQLYDISAISGSAGDSLNISAQRYIVPGPKKIYSYPITAASSWSSASHWTTNFTLTVAAAGLDHVPSTHEYTTHRKDTIVGWGKMRVYTATGPSIEYDVLMDKVSEYVVDSFYVGGSPAPSTLLSGFGMSQGQQTELAYRYMFLMKGSFLYLASLVYMADATFTNPSTLYINKAAVPAGVNDLTNGTYATVLFPNPAAGNEINLMISGANVKADTYYITDMLGRVVRSGAAVLQNGMLHIELGNKLAAGQYTLNVSGGGTRIASEQFSVMQ